MTTLTQEERVSRLPGWARDLLASAQDQARRARAEADEARAVVARALAGEGPSGDVSLHDPLRTGRLHEFMPLPKGVTVRFRVGPHPNDLVEVRTEYDRRDVGREGEPSGVRVNGWGAIIVHPLASNLVVIRPGER